jgi:hypothetical protein
MVTLRRSWLWHRLLERPVSESGGDVAMPGPTDGAIRGPDGANVDCALTSLPAHTDDV